MALLKLSPISPRHHHCSLAKSMMRTTKLGAIMADLQDYDPTIIV
ncbi:hypothetical protein CCACVL1_05001 [Corchorus capsularis]|uniref:Uncharacterized protein n=1 Tax=Corchorus capsularis TaxID=210143 RepID=A0A1R3JNE7_COCAP|nr:hypothetical protein CCACVL1_05001 [Corchorus capsularis]